MSRRRTLTPLGDLRAELEALIAEAQARPVTVTGCSEPAPQPSALATVLAKAKAKP